MTLSLAEIERKHGKIPGVTVRRNERKGFTILRLHYTADPAKRDPSWMEKRRKEYPSDAQWRREMEIDRSAKAGQAYYPAFAEHPERYIKRCPGLIRGPIVRAWDFGGENPACVWMQVSAVSRRVWVLRELLGQNIDTYAFRDLVKYLSGQITLDALKQWPRATAMLDELKEGFADLPTSGGPYLYPPTPWFEGRHSFLDFAGHEAIQKAPGQVKAGEAQTALEILALGEIVLLAAYVLEKRRRSLLNGLAHLRADGVPGILIDPACPILAEALCGGVVFAKPTPSEPDPNAPAKHAVYSHLHEALGYGIVNTVPVEFGDLPMSVGEGVLMPGMGGEEQYVQSYLLNR